MPEYWSDVGNGAAIFTGYTATTGNGHRWSYAFDNLAKEYKRHEKYMGLWKKILPKGSIFQVDYENMVADQEGTSRELLDYIGVGWHPKCTEFYKIKRNVRTASLSQVVRPIYTSSVGRAGKYPELHELRELLYD